MGNIFSDNPIFAIGSIIGLFGILASHRLLIYRERIKLLNDAATEFRKVFHQTLAEIEGKRHGFGIPLSDEIIETHRLAHLNFRPHLRGAHLHQYNEAWEQYCHCCENLANRGIFIRTTHTDLEKDIKHLLTFTKYSFWRDMALCWRRKAHSVRLKIFGPSKKEKESTKKLIKLYEEYYHNKKPLP